jgi:15-cis-phytoene synthase
MFAIDASYQSCSDYTRKHAANFYYAFRHLDYHRRQGIHALYAFCQYADSIVDGDDTRTEKEIQLSSLELAIAGSANDDEQLPAWLLPALRDTIQRFKLPEELLRSFLEGMRMDLEELVFATFEQLRDYAWRVASVVGLLSIEIFGYQNESVKQYAGQLGLALQITNIIRDVRTDAERNRIFLPQEDLERFGVSREDLLGGRTTPAYQELMRFQAERAELYYQATSGLLEKDDRRTMLPSEIMKNIYHRLLHKIIAKGFPLDENVIRLSKGTKIWITLRTRLLLHR